MHSVLCCLLQYVQKVDSPEKSEGSGCVIAILCAPMVESKTAMRLCGPRARYMYSLRYDVRCWRITP